MAETKRAPGGGGPSKREVAPRIPGYRLENVIGRGATGIVYRAVQVSVDRVVALKILRSEFVGTAKAVERLRREAKNTARLSHPHIIGAIDMGEIDGRWWYAMELVDGESLGRRIRRHGALSEREALRYFIPIADALAHLDEMGVVHRDIKPANIVVDQHGRTLLIDLGLAFSDSDPSITRDGGTLGTPHYISPEQARDPSSVDMRSDLWSFGASLYHALVGEPLFAGASVAEILSQVLYSRVPDPSRHAPHLSRGMNLVLRKCLSRDVSKRYQTPEALLSDLELLRERRSPQVQKHELEPVLREGLEPRIIAVLVIGGLLLFTGLWALLGPWRSSPTEVDPAELAGRPALDELAARIEAREAGRMGSQFLELQELVPSLPPEEQARADRLRGALYLQFESTLYELKTRLDGSIESALEAKDFERARKVVVEALPREITGLTGTTESLLPSRIRSELGQWRDLRLEKIDGARTRTAELFRAERERALGKITADVDRLTARDQWRSAFADIDRALKEGFELDERGLPAADAAEANAESERRLSRLRHDVESMWRRRDAQLTELVSERAEALRKRLDRRDLEGAEQALLEEFDAALKERGASRKEIPEDEALPRRSLTTLREKRAELQRLEKRLLLEDAQRDLALLQVESADAWRARRYESLRMTFSEAAEVPWRAPVSADLIQLAREAAACAELLDKARKALRASGGEIRKFTLRSIVVRGRVELGRDGFELVAPGVSHRLALSLPESVSGSNTSDAPSLVAPLDILRLAGIAEEGQGAAEDQERLQAAIFLFHEGLVKEAWERLVAGQALPEGVVALNFLEKLREARVGEDAALAQRAEEAQGLLNALRRRQIKAHDRERTLEEVNRLLTGFAEVLSREESAELHEMQSELRRAMQGGPVGIDRLQELFGPSELSLPQEGRARLVYRFDGAVAGAFESGIWLPDGSGWTAPGTETSEALVRELGPRLLLRAPLVLDRDRIEIELQFEQVAPPDLFTISAGGFHVMLKSQGPRSRLFIGTGTLAETVAAAEAGEGKEFSGREREKRHTLRLSLSQARGHVVVYFDGEEILKSHNPSPKGKVQSRSITLHAIEPVRLLEATIEVPFSDS